MVEILAFFLFATLVIGCGFYRATPKTWIPILMVGLLPFTVLGEAPLYIIVSLWLLLLTTAAFANIRLLRKHILSKPLLKYIRKLLPPMSETERVALEAGDVWFDKELFSGVSDWSTLLNFSRAKLSGEERKFIANEVETLCEMIDEWKMTTEYGDLAPEVWSYIKKKGFLGLVIAKEYGGLGFSAFAHSTIISKITSRSLSAGVSVMVPNSLGPAELLQHYGTEDQKKYYLPRLAIGEDIPCFALTAPEAGSDAAAMPDKGVVCMGKYRDKEVLGIRLNWNKRYITLAPIATVLGLAFKLYDPQRLLNGRENIGITVCLIPTDHPGVEIGNRHSPLNLPFMNGPTRGSDVFIPIDWIVGGPAMAGQGWRMLMECLSIGRSISLPSLNTGAAKLLFRTTGAYSRLRRQFNTSIANFEGVEEALARIGGLTYLMEATRVLTVSAVDQQIKPSLISAIAKYHLTEFSRQIINDAMDIHAGRGIQMGPKNYLGNFYQGIPMSITVEGANILTRNLIIFGQGAMRCHPYIRQEIEAAHEENSTVALIKFDNALFGHLGYTFSNLTKLLLYSVTGGRFIGSPVTGHCAKYFRQLTRMSVALAVVSDVVMLMLGGELKRKERLSARLGDVLSNLYLASAVLKYYQDNGALPEEVPFVDWSVQTCLSRIQDAFEDFFANFPNRVVSRLLRITVFPFGRSYQKPSDKLGHQLARTMTTSSALRDRLTQDCFIGHKMSDPVNRLEAVFNKSSDKKIIDIEKKLHQAVQAGKVPRQGSLHEKLEACGKASILTDNEIELLREFETMRLDAMQVDEFPFDFFLKVKVKNKQKLQEIA